MSNTATTGFGGGLDNEAGGTTTASYSTLQSNTANFGGGGIDNSGTLSIVVSSLSSNSAGLNGGGIGDEAGGALTLANSTLSGNTSTGDGGGLSEAGTGTLSNATIAGNEAGSGGGIFSTGDLTLVNTTIADNSLSTGTGGGGLDANQGSTTLYNTIVASNTDGNGKANNAVGSLAPTSVNNLFGSGGSGGLSALYGNLVNVSNVALGTLASNGGPTETIALLAGSPAIDAGANTISGVAIPETDQRGALRGAAGFDAGANVDIGAYEASSSYLVTTAADSSNVGTLREGIEWANLSTNANPAALTAATTPANTVVFQTTGSFATPQTITLAGRGPRHPRHLERDHSGVDRRHGLQRPDDQRRRRGGRDLGRQGYDGHPHGPDDQRRKRHPGRCHQ